MRDVIVIGAGGGGAVVAKELAEQGLDVLILEAGAHAQDSEQEWPKYESASQGVLRWGAPDPSKGPWRREYAQASTAFSTAGVGGTTLQYFGNSPRAMPGSFVGYAGADKQRYDNNYLFPFSYDELKPYYRWVEKILPVQTAALGTKEEVFIRGAEGIGLHYQQGKDIEVASFRPQENAILQPRGTAGRTDNPDWLKFPFAQGCTYCGHCYQGCTLPMRAPRNLKAKRSTYNSYVPMALTADLWSRHGKAAQVIADAFVTQVMTENTPAGPKAVGVGFRIGATGETQVETAKVIVMAAGAIETPRLWLNSGLPNDNGWVGKGLTTHATEVVTGVMPFETRSSLGPASAVRADFPGYGSMESFGGMPGAYAANAFLGSEAGIAGAYDHSGETDESGADVVGRLVGPALKETMSDINRLVSIVILTDDDVDPRNSVSLSTTQPADENGPIPLVTAQTGNFTNRTRGNREYLTRKAVDLLRAAGATSVIRPKAPPSLIHMQSSMRMGLDPANSVVDENGEARAVQGLYIADNSSLANALGGPNPTLTTQAIATRTAEKIMQKHFGGDGWVSNWRLPVTSIDPRISLACGKRGI
ncbi:MAG: oxidoreductase [Alcanivoracaceae bacterium]|nr:oxidoreductase [Alcanivoracaceae bacterium]MCG8440120.1 GMC family oxidoreductase N-terminal domain-containing protein [Pseudomonadales bacterium]MEE2870413.1 GMC family oxidoreductase N-terminal domain-containing protein [Pseudomonadota bacterium]